MKRAHLAGFLLLHHPPSGACDPGKEISYSRSNTITERNMLLFEHRYLATQKSVEVDYFPYPKDNLSVGKFKISSLDNRYQKGNIDHNPNEDKDGNEISSSTSDEQNVEVDEKDIYKLLLFLAAIFVFGKMAMFVGMPSLVGEIICGFLLGPPLANFVPHPDAIVLVGDIGLIMLMLEAGIGIDVAQLKETGVRALGVACTGSILPLLVGFGLALANRCDIHTAIAVGASFSPTSLGVASNALSSGRILNTPVGQLILASCVLDDIIGLVLLSTIQVFTDDSAKIYEYFIPVFSAIGFLLCLGWCALTWLPNLIQTRLFPILPENCKDLTAFGLMLTLLMLYLPLLYYTKASYLTGAFLAGLSFSQIDSVHKTFVYQTSNLMTWLLRLFFAASIGFQVPITTFWKRRVIGWGFAYYLCVLAKLPIGLYTPKFHNQLPVDFPFDPWRRDVLVTGIAMTCRGEFSFIIAAFSLKEGIFDIETYSSVVWAILLSCITSPLVLLYTISHYNMKSKESLESVKAATGKIPLYIVIQCRSALKWGLQDQLSACASGLGLIIIDQRSWHPRGANAIVVSEIFVQDKEVEVLAVDESGNNIKTKDEEDGNFDQIVAQRCAHIEEAMLNVIGQSSARVKAIRWMPHVFTEDNTTNSSDDLKKLETEAHMELDKREVVDTLLNVEPSLADRVGKTKSLSALERVARKDSAEHRDVEDFSIETIPEGRVASLSSTTPSLIALYRQDDTRANQRVLHPRTRHKALSGPTFASNDLWDGDTKIKQALMRSTFIPTVKYDLSSQGYGQATRQHQVSDLSQLMESSDPMLPSIEEHLEGFVRYPIQVERNAVINAEPEKEKE